MKAVFVLALVVFALAFVNANDHDDDDHHDAYEIPDQFKSEGEALMRELEAAKVPKLPDGSCFDVCKAPDALKAKALAFGEKVNKAGGKIPIPKC
uniref:CSON009388 protein n=1 Tax=Culicoides sonorensis TaxID=179676 RepID=A0A336M096_CULSO